MRLRVVAAGLLLLPAAASAQVWEKYLAPGFTYRMEVNTALPRVLHAFRFSPGNPAVQALPELGGGLVYSETPDKGRETLTGMVRRTGAIGGINADFFPFTGDPLGLMVREGQILSLPDPRRAAFAWGEASSSIGRSRAQVTMQADGREAFVLDGFNQECGENEVVLNDPVAGLAIGQKGEVAHLVLKQIGGAASPNGKLEAEVLYVLPGSSSVPIQPGNLILTASGTKVDVARALSVGQRVAFTFTLDGFDWGKHPNAVSGGPFLISGGQLLVDASAQGFNAAFSEKRHPRTAIGRTSNGDIWFVAVDGRQTVSVGATLGEMARIMQRLGCVDAINLDGGGSTTFNAFGITLNRPSDGKERPVANGILFYGPPVARDEAPLKLTTPQKLEPGDTLTLRVQQDTGTVLPTGDVLWQAVGSGWIDQGGYLRVLAPGTIWVTAYARGTTLTAAIPVEPPSRLDRATGIGASRKGSRTGRSAKPAPKRTPAATKKQPQKKTPAKAPAKRKKS